jgi:LytS/YehU family sensor histidine kinase
MNFQKLAESELKALRAQMNPHFMFNTINSIQELVLGNDDRTARIYFADFAKMMRMILENSTQKLITLEKEIDFLNLYLSFEKVRFKDKFELKLIVDEILETSLLKLPSMLIQPFIENAINHGLLHKESNGKLEVKFEQIDFENEVFLKCTIEDNGIGREAAMKLNKWRVKQHQSISTTVNSERIEILNTIMENKKFYLFITDLKEGETATGTKVELLISI